VDERLAPVLAEIRTLLDLPAGAAGRSRARIEEALTTGYAFALELERDRLRAERGLRRLLEEDARADAAALARAQRELTAAERTLADVRRLLSAARAHALA
jgi:hypothetical protein